MPNLTVSSPIDTFMQSADLPAARAALGLDPAVFNVMSYGALGGARQVVDASISSSTAIVTSATANFTAADLGKDVWAVLPSTGVAQLTVRQITAINSSTSITVSGGNAGTTASNTCLTIGWIDEDTAGIQAAVAAAQAYQSTAGEGVNEGRVVIPAGGFCFNDLLINAVGQKPPAIFEGAGSESTQLFVAGDFDVAAAAAGFWVSFVYHGDNNARFYVLRGFTVNGCYQCQGTGWVSTVAAVGLSGSVARMDDVFVRFTRSATAGYRAFNIESSNDFEMIRCWAVYCGLGIVINQSGGVVERCFTSNCYGWGVQISGGVGVTAGARLVFLNHFADEGGEAYLANVMIGVNVASTDVWFIGGKIFNPVTAGTVFGVDLQPNSVAHFIGTQIVPFGSSGDRSGMKVGAGATAYLTDCVLQKSNSGVALTNGGTVVIAGNDAITSLTGATTLVAADGNRGFDNTGATAQVIITLPTCSKGLKLKFIVTDADGIRALAAAGDIITVGANVGTAAGYTESTTIGSVLVLEGIDATNWIATSVVGTWSNPT